MLQEIERTVSGQRLAAAAWCTGNGNVNAQSADHPQKRIIEKGRAVGTNGTRTMNRLMMVRALITFALLTFCFNAWGQDSLIVRGQTFVIRDLPSNAKTDIPLFIIKVDGKSCHVPASGRFTRTRQLKRAFAKFNADLVQSVDIIKGRDATDKYGAPGKYGVIIINMKDGTYEDLPRKFKKECRDH